MLDRPHSILFESISSDMSVANSPELPLRLLGEGCLSTLVHAELISTDTSGVTLKAATVEGDCLFAQVDAAGDGIIRVRLREDPSVVSRASLTIPLVTPEVYEDTIIEIDDLTVVVHAGPISAEITLDPWHLRFVDANGRLLVGQNPGEQDASGRLCSLAFGRSRINGEVVAYHESFTAAADERFVGFGEKFTELNKRGQHPLMWHFDASGSDSNRSYKNVPFYYSSRGYGVLVDSGAPVEFDVCHSTHGCVQIVVPDDLIDYYVLAGPTFSEIIDRYNRITCRPTLPPKWAFGTWMAAGFRPDSQAEVLERAATIRKRGIPADVLHLDCYWQIVGHWSDLRWDREHFPDPRRMLSSLAKRGFRVSLQINPYISHLSPLYDHAARHNYFLVQPDGAVHLADVWNGTFPPCGVVDFTNRDAMLWFTGLLRPLLRQGVAAFATDLTESLPPTAIASNGMTGAELHNIYTMLFNDAVADVTKEIAGHSMVWTRSSFTGGQRHAPHWSGEARCTYPSMGSTLRGGLSHGLSGVPFWSHDVGGCTGTPTADLYVRWAQFGALSPLVRFHGMTSRLPWDFPAHAERAVVEALRLRYSLLPYLYSAAVEAAETGTPMMRALLIDSPDDPAAWGADLEYRLGRDLLAAPMINQDGTRMVYLPAGEWVDHWTGTVHTGSRYLRVTPPLDRLPLFVRHGALIPVVDVAATVPDGPFADLTLVSWGGRTSRTVLRDVDGTTTVTALRSGDKFDIRSTGPAVIQSVAFAFVHGDQPPRSLKLNGKELPIETR
ncbi:MAG: alpha-xylosidase [Micromonosporaceae bacterium]|nr:alpha-xylosidase [Micromonosporaceae bacterium]